MNTVVTTHPWSEDALFSKARLYVERMEACTPDDWQFGFWSTLTLELLARAALAHISPVLLAEKSNWRNVTYALGIAQTSMKHFPKSISMMDVLSRLKELLSDFDEETLGFCRKHVERRNTELHSGDLAFVNVGTSMWLPRFYLACDLLLQSMDRTIEEFVSSPDAVRSSIDGFRDAAASTVKEDVKAHMLVWQGKSETEQRRAGIQAVVWARRQSGHRVTCPSCNSHALLQGQPSGPVTTVVEEEEVEQRQTQLPSSFECIACGLRISGLSKLATVDLGNAFSVKRTYSAAEFFNLHTEEELEEARNEWPEFEPDFNE